MSQQKQKQNCPKITTCQKPLSATKPFQFSIVSYNVLAQVYIDERYTYVPDKYLSFNHRGPKLREELLSFNSDIICLQEVQIETFEQDFGSLMSSKGYECILQNDRNRGVSHPTCNAVLFRKSRFQFISCDSRSRAMMVTVKIVKTEEENKYEEEKQLEQKKLNEENKEEKKCEMVFPQLLHICNVHLEGWPYKCVERFNQMQSLIKTLKKKTT